MSALEEYRKRKVYLAEVCAAGTLEDLADAALAEQLERAEQAEAELAKFKSQLCDGCGLDARKEERDGNQSEEHAVNEMERWQKTKLVIDISLTHAMTLEEAQEFLGGISDYIDLARSVIAELEAENRRTQTYLSDVMDSGYTAVERLESAGLTTTERDAVCSLYEIMSAVDLLLPDPGARQAMDYADSMVEELVAAPEIAEALN